MAGNGRLEKDANSAEAAATATAAAAGSATTSATADTRHMIAAASPAAPDAATAPQLQQEGGEAAPPAVAAHSGTMLQPLPGRHAAAAQQASEGLGRCVRQQRPTADGVALGGITPVAQDLREARARLACCVRECGADARQLQGRNAHLAACALALAAGDANKRSILAQFEQSLRETGELPEVNVVKQARHTGAAGAEVATLTFGIGPLPPGTEAISATPLLEAEQVSRACTVQLLQGCLAECGADASLIHTSEAATLAQTLEEAAVFEGLRDVLMTVIRLCLRKGGCWPPGLGIALVECGIAIEFDYPSSDSGAELEALSGKGRILRAGFCAKPPAEPGGRSTVGARLDVAVRALPVEGLDAEGQMLVRCVTECGAPLALMAQLTAVAAAKRLKAAGSEADRLRLLLRVRASLTKRKAWPTNLGSATGDEPVPSMAGDDGDIAKSSSNGMLAGGAVAARQLLGMCLAESGLDPRMLDDRAAVSAHGIVAASPGGLPRMEAMFAMHDSLLKTGSWPSVKLRNTGEVDRDGREIARIDFDPPRHPFDGWIIGPARVVESTDERQVTPEPARGTASVEVRRMITRFNAWLRKYISKHCPLGEEGANILDRLSQALSIPEVKHDMHALPTVAHVEHAVAWLLDLLKDAETPLDLDVHVLRALVEGGPGLEMHGNAARSRHPFARTGELLDLREVVVGLVETWRQSQRPGENVLLSAAMPLLLLACDAEYQQQLLTLVRTLVEKGMSMPIIQRALEQRIAKQDQLMEAAAAKKAAARADGAGAEAAQPGSSSTSTAAASASAGAPAAGAARQPPPQAAGEVGEAASSPAHAADRSSSLPKQKQQPQGAAKRPPPKPQTSQPATPPAGGAAAAASQAQVAALDSQPAGAPAHGAVVAAVGAAPQSETAPLQPASSSAQGGAQLEVSSRRDLTQPAGGDVQKLLVACLEAHFRGLCPSNVGRAAQLLDATDLADLASKLPLMEVLNRVVTFCCAMPKHPGQTQEADILAALQQHVRAPSLQAASQHDTAAVAAFDAAPGATAPAAAAGAAASAWTQLTPQQRVQLLTKSFTKQAAQEQVGAQQPAQVQRQVPGPGQVAAKSQKQQQQQQQQKLQQQNAGEPSSPTPAQAEDWEYEGHTLRKCLSDTGAGMDLMLQPGAAAVAQQLATAGCETDVLRLLLRVRTSLWKGRDWPRDLAAGIGTATDNPPSSGSVARYESLTGPDGSLAGGIDTAKELLAMCLEESGFHDAGMLEEVPAISAGVAVGSAPSAAARMAQLLATQDSLLRKGTWRTPLGMGVKDGRMDMRFADEEQRELSEGVDAGTDSRASATEPSHASGPAAGSSESGEVHRMVTRFRAWLSKYLTKHCTASQEGTAILDRLGEVLAMDEMVEGLQSLPTVAHVEHAVAWALDIIKDWARFDSYSGFSTIRALAGKLRIYGDAARKKHRFARTGAMLDLREAFVSLVETWQHSGRQGVNMLLPEVLPSLLLATDAAAQQELLDGVRTLVDKGMVVPVIKRALEQRVAKQHAAAEAAAAAATAAAEAGAGTAGAEAAPPAAGGPAAALPEPGGGPAEAATGRPPLGTAAKREIGAIASRLSTRILPLRSPADAADTDLQHHLSDPALVRDFMLLSILTSCNLRSAALQKVLDATDLVAFACGLPLAELGARLENFAEAVQGIAPEAPEFMAALQERMREPSGRTAEQLHTDSPAAPVLQALVNSLHRTEELPDSPEGCRPAERGDAVLAVMLAEGQQIQEQLAAAAAHGASEPPAGGDTAQHSPAPAAGDGATTAEPAPAAGTPPATAKPKKRKKAKGAAGQSPPSSQAALPSASPAGGTAAAGAAAAAAADARAGTAGAEAAPSAAGISGTAAAASEPGGSPAEEANGRPPLGKAAKEDIGVVSARLAERVMDPDMPDEVLKQRLSDPELVRDFILLTTLTRCNVRSAALEEAMDATDMVSFASGLPLAELAARLDTFAEAARVIVPEVWEVVGALQEHLQQPSGHTAQELETAMPAAPVLQALVMALHRAGALPAVPEGCPPEDQAQAVLDALVAEGTQIEEQLAAAAACDRGEPPGGDATQPSPVFTAGSSATVAEPAPAVGAPPATAKRKKKKKAKGAAGQSPLGSQAAQPSASPAGGAASAAEPSAPPLQQTLPLQPAQNRGGDDAAPAAAALPGSRPALHPDDPSGTAADSMAAAAVADAAASEATAAASQLRPAGEDGAAAQTTAPVQPQGMAAASAAIAAEPAGPPAAPLEARQPQGHAPQQRQTSDAPGRRYSRSMLFQLLEAGGACSLPDFAAAREGAAQWAAPEHSPWRTAPQAPVSRADVVAAFGSQQPPSLPPAGAGAAAGSGCAEAPPQLRLGPSSGAAPAQHADPSQRSWRPPQPQLRRAASPAPAAGQQAVAVAAADLFAAAQAARQARERQPPQPPPQATAVHQPPPARVQASAGAAPAASTSAAQQPPLASAARDGAHSDTEAQAAARAAAQFARQHLPKVAPNHPSPRKQHPAAAHSSQAAAGDARALSREPDGAAAMPVHSNLPGSNAWPPLQQQQQPQLQVQQAHQPQQHSQTQPVSQSQAQPQPHPHLSQGSGSASGSASSAAAKPKRKPYTPPAAVIAPDNAAPAAAAAAAATAPAAHPSAAPTAAGPGDERAAWPQAAAVAAAPGAVGPAAAAEDEDDDPFSWLGAAAPAFLPPPAAHPAAEPPPVPDAAPTTAAIAPAAAVATAAQPAGRSAQQQAEAAAPALRQPVDAPSASAAAAAATPQAAEPTPAPPAAAGASQHGRMPAPPGFDDGASGGPAQQAGPAPAPQPSRRKQRQAQRAQQQQQQQEQRSGGKETSQPQPESRASSSLPPAAAEQQGADMGPAAAAAAEQQAAGAGSAAAPAPAAALPSTAAEPLQTADGMALSPDLADMCCCPISHEVMDDPVIAADGFTYDRESIEEWLRRSSNSPMTNEPLASLALTPNLALALAIPSMVGSGA